MVGAPAPNSAIQLPFIVVNTNKKTNIEVNISNDKMEYLFNFDDTFEIHDDMEVRMVKFDVILVLMYEKPLYNISNLIIIGFEAHGSWVWTRKRQCKT